MPSDGTTAPSSSSDAAANAELAAAPAASLSTNTIEESPETIEDSVDGANQAPESVSKASEGIANASESTEDAEGVEKPSDGSDSEKADDGVEDNTDGQQEDDSKTNSEVSKNDSSTNNNNENGSENSAESTKNDSPRHENNGDDPTDSTHPDNPSTPVDGEFAGSAPVDLPSEDGDYTPPFSGDDSTNDSYLTDNDSNAPPGASTDSPPPPDDGTYYIRWEVYPTYWMGRDNENLKVSVEPESTYGLDWFLSRVTTTSFDNVYTLRNGSYYLSRSAEYPEDHDVTLSSALSENSYWRIVAYTNVKGQTVYYLFDMNEENALTFTLDSDWYVDACICDSYGMDRLDLGSTYRFFFDKAQPQDWDILYEGNGATSGSTNKTVITVSDGGTVSECGYERFGYTFLGWNTAADGTGTSYAVGQHIAGGDVLASGYYVVLYAQWKEVFANVTYTSAGGGQVQLGTNGTKGSNLIQTVSAGTGILKDTQSTPLQGVTAVATPGYHFGSWVLAGGIGQIPSSLKNLVTLSAEQIASLSKTKDSQLYQDMVLLADFIPNSYTVKFNANGGTGSMAAKKLTYGDVNPVTVMNGLKRTNYLFKGWNTRADGSGIAITNSATLANLISSGALRNADGASTTLYAVWAKDPNANTSDIPAGVKPVVSGTNKPSNNGGSSTPSKPVTSSPSSPSNAPAQTASSANVTVPVSSYTGRSYAYTGYYEPSGDVPVAEAATLDEPFMTQGNNLKTITPRNSGPFDAIGQFFTTGTGRIVAIICGIGIGIAVIAGIAAAVLHFAGAGAGAGAAAGADSAAKASRVRKRRLTKKK